MMGKCERLLRVAVVAVGVLHLLDATTETAAPGMPTGQRAVGFDALAFQGIDGNVAGVAIGQGATITVTAPTIFKHLTWNQNAFTAAGTGQMPVSGPVDRFEDRTLWVPPGVVIFLAGNIATLAKVAPYIAWIEHDWPLV